MSHLETLKRSTGDQTEAKVSFIFWVATAGKSASQLSFQAAKLMVTDYKCNACLFLKPQGHMFQKLKRILSDKYVTVNCICVTQEQKV